MTPTQHEMYVAIDEYWKKHGFGPSIEDLRRITGHKAKSNVHRLCGILVKRGYCREERTEAGFRVVRSIRPSYMRKWDMRYVL